LTPIGGEAYLDGASCSSLPAPAWRHSVALVLAESQWWSERVGDHFDQGVDAAWLAQLGLPDSAMSWESLDVRPGKGSGWHCCAH
jgi:hypothetical protein